MFFESAIPAKNVANCIACIASILRVIWIPRAWWVLFYARLIVLDKGMIDE